ncbi:hypothetical protein [Micromonospora sp. WMMD737]|uniref:hypothetical protein n=1 Tax=Micromonospora sp. WMMD737 TaxID=3404113 RepID=UPI003B941D82
MDSEIRLPHWQEVAQRDTRVRRAEGAATHGAVVAPSGSSRYLREADGLDIADRLREQVKRFTKLLARIR